MKPPYCAVCTRMDPDAELLRFTDYEPLPDGMVGHPKGLVWFCPKHVAKARALLHLSSTDALNTLGARG